MLGILRSAVMPVRVSVVLVVAGRVIDVLLNSRLGK
jgi:hypothetical protein